MISEKRRLGRGLDALLGGAISGSNPDLQLVGEGSGQAPLTVPLERIALNPYQPRKDFDPEAIAALSESLKQHGLLQPIVVRPTAMGFELIAGERRLRAAKEAGWTTIPVHVLELNDQAVFEAALVENVQRSDLNPIEKALGFQEYLRKYEVTQDELAKKIGVDRSTISNLIRILELPTPVQDAVRQMKITFGHARALAAFTEPERQEKVCEEIIACGLSVRQVEALAKETKAQPSPVLGISPHAVNKTARIKMVEEELRAAFSTRVEIKMRGTEKGQLVLHFENEAEFERLLGTMRRMPAAA